MTTVLVCGSRRFPNTHIHLMEKILRPLKITKIIHGGAIGVDTLAGVIGEQWIIPTVVLKPDWKRHGRGAGFVRNIQMLDMKPDIVVAFYWTEVTNGTKHTVTNAKKRGINTKAYIGYYNFVLELVEQ